MTRVAVFIVLLAAVLMMPLTARADKLLGKGTTDGTFVGVEVGDYAHFLMKDARGAQQSFFIVKGDGTVDKFVDAPAKYKGKKIRVSWQKVISNIPEAGGSLEIKQVTSVKLR